jgi:soluble lytic murein transglycosylase-like protein
MKRLGSFIGALLLASVASASNCPTGDALLKNNTPLASQCPNGFTSNPSALGSSNIGTAMQSQSSNVQMISAAAQNDGVPVDLALAVSYQEARFNSCAGSQTGVKGPMQLTQQTAKGLGYNRDIDQQNIQGGMGVLKQAVNACGATNYACLSAHYNGSNPTQQAQWAQGVQNADQQLKNNPTLLASSCSNGGQNCVPGTQGDFSAPPSTQVSSSV